MAVILGGPGIYLGGASAPPTPPPFVNQYSMTFDGSLDYFTAGNTLNLANDGTDAFSFSCWVKSTDSNTQMLVAKQLNTSPFNGYNFSISGGGIRFFLGTTTSSAYIQGTTSNLGNLLDGNWHHLVLTYDGSQDISGFTIYYDNTTPTITTTVNNTPNDVSNSALFMLGARGTLSSYGFFFNGNLDEVAYFNTELSASDVSAIYNLGVPTSLSSYPSLVSWWRMGDGDTWNGSSWILTDNGSGGNDATSVSMPQEARLPITPNSYSQNSFVFDGIGDYFNVGNPASLQITGALTLSAWVKTTNTTTGGMIIGKDGVSSGTRSYILNLTSTGESTFYVFKSTGTQFVQSTSQINDGLWHHVMAVNDGADLKIYIDGTLENTTVGGGGTMLNGTSYFAIGRREANAPQNILWYNGKIDEVAVWNSDQSANISTIFNNGVPQDISSLSPVSHWRMGESATWNGSTWTLTDQGSGGNDGTSVSMPEEAKTGDQPYVI